MPLTSQGVGSGLDIKGIIDKLMSVERQPLVKLDTRTVELKAQVSAYGSLKSAVSTFRDAVDKLADIEKFKVYAATSSDKDVLDATATSSAARGVYNIQVNRIAENHRMASATTYADTGTTAIGTAGEIMTLGVGGSQFVVAIGGTTLSQIRDSINAAADNSGVTASIIKDNAGFRLSLSSNTTGSAKALSASYSAADPFALATLNTAKNISGIFISADLDASIRLEGKFDITSSSNSLADTIQGVTLNLKKAGTITLNVARDSAAVDSSVRNFAAAYSTLVSTMGKMRNQVLKSDTSTLLNIEAHLRSVLTSPSRASTKFSNAFEIGFSTLKSGNLELNSTVLTNALQSDFDGVANLFADKNFGLAKQLRTLADGFLATGGALDGRSAGLDSELRFNASKKSSLIERINQIELRYTKQFNALDSVVAQLNQTSALVTQQLNLLNNNSNSRR